jgi:hypothetical protein
MAKAESFRLKAKSLKPVACSLLMSHASGLPLPLPVNLANFPSLERLLLSCALFMILLRVTLH